MSDNICPVIRLPAPRAIPGADKIEVFDVVGSGPCVTVKGQFKEGDLACFIPPETLVNSARPEFEFLQKRARKSDGWARVKPIRMRGQISVGLLMDPYDMKLGSNGAKLFNVKKTEDFEPKQQGPKVYSLWQRLIRWVTGKSDQVGNAPWPGIPVYDISQLYKLTESSPFNPDDLMIMTEKIHGTNARYVIGRDGQFRVGSRTRWLEPMSKLEGITQGNGLKMTLWHQAAIDAGIEGKLRRLKEPLVLWGEIAGPGVQKGFDYGFQVPTFVAFDMYNCDTRKFLNPKEVYDICHWLGIIYVPIAEIDKWSVMQESIKSRLANEFAPGHPSHPAEGCVVRPYNRQGEVLDLSGNRNLLAGKVINPAYYEFRSKNGLDEENDKESADVRATIEDPVVSVGGPM